MPKLSFLNNSSGAQRPSEHFRQSLEVFEKSSKSSKVTRIFSEIPLMTKQKNLALDSKKVDWYNSCFKLCNHVKGLNPGAISSVQNIPKFKDRANWSRNTFQPMRRRACVYQQTNQKFSKQRKELDRISDRFEALRHIFLRLFMRHTQFFK